MPNTPLQYNPSQQTHNTLYVDQFGIWLGNAIVHSHNAYIYNQRTRGYALYMRVGQCNGGVVWGGGVFGVGNGLRFGVRGVIVVVLLLLMLVVVVLVMGCRGTAACPGQHVERKNIAHGIGVGACVRCTILRPHVANHLQWGLIGRIIQ